MSNRQKMSYRERLARLEAHRSQLRLSPLGEMEVMDDMVRETESVLKNAHFGTPEPADVAVDPGDELVNDPFDMGEEPAVAVSEPAMDVEDPIGEDLEVGVRVTRDELLGGEGDGL